MPLGDYIGGNRRPVAGWTSGDLKTFFLLPHGRRCRRWRRARCTNVHPRPVSEDCDGAVCDVVWELPAAVGDG